MPGEVPRTLERDRIAFISYSAFCPTYAGRYDGVFPFLSPFSFFMPVAVLGVQASSFVYGIAHTNVSLAAEAIRAVRPDLQHGIVVATELSQQEMMESRRATASAIQPCSTGLIRESFAVPILPRPSPGGQQSPTATATRTTRRCSRRPSRRTAARRAPRWLTGTRP